MQTTTKTTNENVEQLLKYLELVRQNGQSMDCISIAYLKMLDHVLKHVKVRQARGEWSK